VLAVLRPVFRGLRLGKVLADQAPVAPVLQC